MKVVIVLMGPGQLEALIADLQAAQTSLETQTIALILSEEPIRTQRDGFTFPRESNLYTGPIYTLGLKRPLEEIHKDLSSRGQVN